MFTHKKNSFAAWILRLKNITRWPLMHSLREENCSSHSFEVTVIAHIIALIGVEKFGKSYSPSDIAVAALYHEGSESGGVSDVPSPVKYANPEITKAIKALEHQVESSLVYGALPEYLHKHFESLVIQQNVPTEIKQIVKAGDDIAAYLKAREELKLGNEEFVDAESVLLEKIHEHCAKFPEVQEFVSTQMPHCAVSLDKLTRIDDKS